MRESKCKPKQHEISLNTHICPICLSDDITLFIKLTGLPIHCHLPLKSHDDALKISKGDMHLSHCSACDHIFNQVFDPRLMTYDQGYDNSLHFSPYFQEYALTLATRLMQTYDIYGKQVVEIGCGTGDFLSLICTQGNNRGTGFDPSFGADRSRHQLNETVAIVQDYYSARYADCAADLIVCRHVLEHIQNPREFLLNLRKTLESSDKTILYVEVPNAAFTLRELGIWDLIYEHCSYFSAQSLVRLFQSCGFQVHHCREDFHGQYLGIEVSLHQKTTDASCRSDNDFESLHSVVQVFSEAFRHTLNKWRNEVTASANNGNRIVVWGAGSKGVTFLNALHVQDEIKYVVDINPNKQGHYVAGTGQQIVHPEFLADYKPSCIIVMNPVYIDEVSDMVKHMSLKAQIISV